MTSSDQKTISKTGQVLPSQEISRFPPKKILVPTDGSENANRAVKTAIELAKKYDAELTIITVSARDKLALQLASDFPAPSPSLQQYYDEMDRRSDKILEESTFLAKKEGCIKVKSQAVPEFESVTKQIVAHAQKDETDLIVIGTRGLGGFKRLLLGSVSSGVVTRATCNVLVVR